MTPVTHTPPPLCPIHQAGGRVPRWDRWPEAVRSAELRAGSLVRCGPGYRPVGWPETPRVRAAALAPWLGAGRTAVLGTAAWIWGAAREPGSPLEIATEARAELRAEHGQRVRLRELGARPRAPSGAGNAPSGAGNAPGRAGRAPGGAGNARDLPTERARGTARLDGIGVSVPTRTAADLLRLSPVLTPRLRLACRLLLASAFADREAIGRELAQGPAPHRRRALERLAEL